MFPRQCLGRLESDSFSMKLWTSPSGHSVLRGKGQRGVNVTFYLRIFHRRGGEAAGLVGGGKETDEEVRERRRETARGREGEGERGGVEVVCVGTGGDNDRFFYYRVLLLPFSHQSFHLSPTSPTAK